MKGVNHIETLLYCNHAASFAHRLGSVDQAGSNVPIHMEGVTCDGTETSLGDCQFSDVSDTNFHGNDVYIVCLPPQNQSGKLYVVLLEPCTLNPHTPLVEGDLRLKGNVMNGRGVVEVFTRLGWTTICPDLSWTSDDARTICRNLGYESGVVAK